MSEASWLTLDFLLIEFDIVQMERFLGLVSSLVVTKQAQNEELLKGFIDEDGNLFVPEEHVDEYLEGIHDFPQFALGGFIFSWYSFVEQKMVDISQSIAVGDINFDSSKCRKDQGIELAQCVFKHFGFVIQELFWQELIRIRNFRNRLVHHGYDIWYFSNPLSENTKLFKKPDNEVVYLAPRNENDRYMESVLRYALRHNLVKDDGSIFKIIPTEDYCRYLLGFSRKLFENLKQQIAI